MTKIRIFALAALLAVSGCKLLIDEQQVFQPNPNNRRPPDASLALDSEAALPETVSLQHMRLETDIGPIAATLADTDSNRLIVHCGGNAADRKTSGVPYLMGLIPFGDVVIFDYPGYGDSAGTPTASQIETAIAEVASYAKERQPDELVIWGQSLGGFVCATMASEILDDISLVVFETSARNAQEVAESWTPWYAKPFISIEIADGLDAWDNVNALANFSGQVLVLGAGEDRVLPVSLSRNLAEDLKDAGLKTLYVEFDDATHMNVPRQQGFQDAVNRALQGAL